MRIRVVLGTALLLAPAVSALAATRVVPSQYPTIQAAIDACVDGDVVIVALGRYIGDGNRDIDFKGKAITVRSTDPNDWDIVSGTIIDCNGTEDDPHNGFYFHSQEDSSSVLSGLTITNGSGRYRGGAVACHYYSGPTIINCIISHNRGGGISGDGDGLTVIGCIICDNLHAAGIEAYTATIIDSVITRNTNCTGARFGAGGIAAVEATVINCVVSGNINTNRYGAGGVHAGYATIKDSTFSDNTNLGRGGGAIHCGSRNHGVCKITNCVIVGNTADCGAGVYLEADGHEISTITNCAILNNSALSNGGAIHAWAGCRALAIANCILRWNNAASGPEIYLEPGLDNDAWVTHDNVAGGLDGVWIGDGWSLNWGPGNIDADPCFAFGRDFRLMSGSPCIDAGTNTPIGGLPAADIESNPRPLDSDGDGVALADMGAYEHVFAKPSIALSCSSISFSCVRGGAPPEPRTLLIRNSGSGRLNWQIMADCEWVQVSPNRGMSTGSVDEVTLTVDPTTLGKGHHRCILAVTDRHATNSPMTVPVSLQVGEILSVPGQFPTIQAAVDAARDGDVVIVAPGTYTGGGNYSIDSGARAITIRSAEPDVPTIVAATVIDCNGSSEQPRGVFRFHDNLAAKSILAGFTITGAHDVSAISAERSNLTVTNCILAGNSHIGLYCRDSNATVTKCRLTGGEIAVESVDSRLAVANCVISISNTAGILCARHYYPQHRVGTATIADSIIVGSRGAGLYFDESPGTVVNCTITENRKWGGGVYVSGCSVSLANCIVWGNRAPVILEDTGVVSAAYSDIQGGWEGSGNIDADPCFVQRGYWDVNGTPDYIWDDFWVDGDYHLIPESSCVNAGDPNYAAEANETDIDGQIRVWDGRIDMGADEFVPPVECRMRLTPRVLNLDSQGKWVKAQLVLPAGYTVSDVDADARLLIRPLGIESQHVSVSVDDDGTLKVKADFERADFCGNGPFDGTITVEGQLVTGQAFYGTASIKVIDKSWEKIASVASYWLRTDCGGPDWCSGLDLDRDSTVNLVDLAGCQSCCVEVFVK